MHLIPSFSNLLPFILPFLFFNPKSPRDPGQLCYDAKILVAQKSLLLGDCPSSMPQACQTVEDGWERQNAWVRHSSTLSQLWQVSLCDGLWDVSACHPAFSIFHVACFLLLKWEEKKILARNPFQSETCLTPQAVTALTFGDISLGFRQIEFRGIFE